MSNITANVSTQVADVHRAPQSLTADRRSQVEAVERARGSGEQVAADPVAADDVRAAAAQVQQVVEAASGRELTFELHDGGEGGRDSLVVQIRDRATDEVIRQIPAEEVLTLRERITEVVGLLFADEA